MATTRDDQPRSGLALTSRIHLPTRTITPVGNIALRLLLALAALVLTSAVVYYEGDCYADRGDLGGITWVDAFYYATVSLSTTGYGDIVPVCESARLVNIFIITPMRFLFLIVLVGTTVEVLTRKTREEFRTSRWRKRVDNHTVIVGFGVKGRSAAAMLIESGIDPSTIVAVSIDKSSIEEANRMGITGVVGDGRREDVLRDASVQRAAKVIVATDSDDTSVLVTLTVRRLTSTAEIVAAVRESQNSEVMRQSGANSVIPTAESAGHLMAISLMSPAVGELMEDLLDSGRGLEVVQRMISPKEQGMAPGDVRHHGEIVLAVIRDGHALRFDQSDIQALQAGDDLVVIRQAPAGA